MMKTRTILPGIMAAAVIALSGCERFETAPVTEGVPFTIGAANAELKTVNDGVKTKWAKNDAINVFHAVAGTTTYVNDGEFIASEDGSTVDFEGSLASALETGSTYDWFAFYPYTSQIKTPANTSAGYATVGSSASGVQVQKASDSRAHVAGKNFPVVGVAAGVPSSDKPEIVMKNVTTLMKVVVTNATASAINVSGIALTAEDNLVGTYYIDFTDPDNIGFVGSGASYVSKTATLSVDDGAGAIAAGGTGNFYLAVKPFTAAAGSELKISVTAENGLQETTKEVTSAVEFKSGKVNTLNVTYNKTTSTNVYRLVSSPDDLTVGSKVIFVASNYNYAMGDQNGKYREQVSISKGAGVINDPSGVAVFTVGSGVDSNYYSFSEESAYLNAPGGGNNLDTVSAIDAKSTWKIDFSATGSISGIKSTNPSATQVVLSYNKANPRFSCYADVLTNDEIRGDVVIYKLDGSGDDTKVVTFVDVPNTLDVNLGSTPSLAAKTNSSATVTYLSGTPSVATISADGTITPVAAGTTTITASVGATGKYAAVTKTCIITVKAAEKWVKTPLASITAADEFVIVGVKTGSNAGSYAMTNNNGTSTAPSAHSVSTVTSGTEKLISGSVPDNIKWTLSVSGSNYTFYPNGDTTKWLYCTATNNGVRVGTNSAKVFTLDTTGYLKHSGTSRFLGVYNAQDWRCYTSSTSTNIANQTFEFYVKK